MTHYELNHVALHVADVKKSCEFYRGTLKLEPMERPAFDFPGAWFRLGEFQELHLIGDRVDALLPFHRNVSAALVTPCVPANVTNEATVPCP